MRRDLPWAQRTIQAAHAVANLVFRRRDELDPGSWGEYGPNFVVYGVAGEGELLEIEKSLSPLAVSFHEPDLSGRLTAIAYLGPPLERFNELSLL